MKKYIMNPKIGGEYLFTKSGSRVRVLTLPDKKRCCEVERVDTLKKMIVPIGALYPISKEKSE